MKKFMYIAIFLTLPSIATPFAHIDSSEYGSAIIPGVQPGVTWGTMMSGLFEVLFPAPNDAEPHPERDYQARKDARLQSQMAHAASFLFHDKKDPLIVAQAYVTNYAKDLKIDTNEIANFYEAYIGEERQWFYDVSKAQEESVDEPLRFSLGG